ncbi:MFS transporter [Amycolatopsis pigmentata]|uniref:MFS transporter n=1 Tax=Amycolatopsis pigmentata TaxID=450801 RepID=A0ABW5FM45_9PSEU
MKLSSTRSETATTAVVSPSAVRAWVVTILLLGFMLINFADKAVLGLAAKPIMHDLGLSASDYGLLSSAFYFLFSISAIVVGFVSNRVRTKWVLLVMAVIWALSQLPVAGAAGFGVLLASRVVLGAAEGPANPVAMHAASKWFPNEKRSLPSAVLNMGSAIGVTLGAPLLTAVIVGYGWRWAFFSLFAVGMVWVLVWALLGKEGTVASTASVHAADAPLTEADEPRVPYRRILLSGTWLGGFFAGFAAYWALTLLTAWVPPYLETALGYSVSTTGTLVILPWAALAVFNLGQGAVTEWLMRRGVSSRLARGVLGGVAVLVAGAAMVLFPVTGSRTVQLVLLTIAFSLGGIIFAIALTVNAEISPTRQRGAVLSISIGLITTAGLLAPYLTGRIVEAAGKSTAGYTLAFTIAGVLSLAGGLLAVIFIRPERDARRLGLRTAAD